MDQRPENLEGDPGQRSKSDDSVASASGSASPASSGRRTRRASTRALSGRWRLLCSALLFLAACGGAVGIYRMASSPSTESAAQPPLTALEALATGHEASQGSTDPRGEQGVLPEEDPWELPAKFPEDSKVLLAEAEEMMGRLVQRYPEDPDAWEMQARLHFYGGQTSEAIGAWEQCLRLDAGYVHALEGLGSAAARQGDHSAAASFYRRALKLVPDSARTQTELARVLIDQGELDEALTILEQLTASGAGGAEPWVLMGMAYAQRQEHAPAKESYQEAVARNPHHANAHWGLATVSMRLGLPEDARRHQQEFERLRAAERQDRRQQRSGFEDLETIAQDIAGTYVQAAKVCFSHQDLAAAEGLLKRAAILNPRDVDCRQALAWLYLQKQQPQATIEMLQELAALEPDNSSYELEIARLYENGRRITEAEKTLQHLSQEHPQDAIVQASLGEFYLRTNRKTGEAVALSRKAAELQPSGPHYALLAMALEREGDSQGAVAALRQAVEREPNNAAYREMLERLRQELAELEKQ